MSFFNFEIEGSEELLAEFEEANRDTYTVLANAARRLKPFVRDSILNVFRKAASHGGEGFPSIYAQHLLNVVSSMPIVVEGGDSGILIEVDLEEFLGTYEEFEEGFHYGAALDGGGQVELPYTGEDLKNDYEARLQFWTSVATGSHIPGMARTEGKLAETYAARVAYWDSIGRAPQWLLLNYGQTATYPEVAPYPIIEEIAALEYGGLGSILDQELNNSLSRIFKDAYTPRYETEYHAFTAKPNLEYIRGAGGRFQGSRRKQ